MIDVILAGVILVLVGLVYGGYKIITGKPTHEDKLEGRRSIALTTRLEQANALLTELKIIDALMPSLPADFKTKLNNYLGGKAP